MKKRENMLCRKADENSDSVVSLYRTKHGAFAVSPFSVAPVCRIRLRPRC